ncbi:MAG: HAMP domain-containing sensor histidine kinase [Sphingomonadaceae bacterium]
MTLVALIAATLVNFAVTFSGPPALRRPAILSQIVPTLTGAAPVMRDYPWISVSQRQDFIAGRDELPLPKTADGIADKLGLQHGAVRLTARAGQRNLPLRDPASELFESFTLGLHLPDGHWRIVRADAQPVVTLWHVVTLSLMLLVAIVFAFLALMVARSVVRPLERLGHEADRTDFASPAAITISGPPEVVRVARAVAAMRDRLANALEERTTLFTALAHDMAAPVSRLRFRLAKLPGAERDAAERDVAELSEMIAGIIELSALGRRTQEHTAIEVIAIVRDLAMREGVPFTTDVSSAIVYGSASGLVRLFSNLIVNARRYAGGGELSAAVQTDQLVIRVSDRGPGIPSRLAERIFEPFFRIESSRSREFAGAGLGLAIARAIAEAHGGTLIYSARDGGGATFSVSIPRVLAGRNSV